MNHCIDCGIEISDCAARCKSHSNTYRWRQWQESGEVEQIKARIAAGVTVAWERGDFEDERTPHIWENGIEGKVCSTCGQWGTLAEFYKSTQAWDGCDYMCRACRHIQQQDKLRRAGNRCIDCGAYIDYRAIRCEECNVAFYRTEHENRDGIDGKTCLLCGQWTPLTNFYKNIKAWDGCDYVCKECRGLRRHQDNEQAGRQCVDCGQPIGLRATRCQTCAPLSHPPKNPHVTRNGAMGKVCSTCQEWKPLEEFCKGDRWDSLNHRCRACRAERAGERRARITGVDIDEIDMEAVFARDGYHCVYCGSLERLSIDHIIPLDSRGPHCEDNLTTACLSCNSSKGAKSLVQWMADGGWWQLKGAGYGAQEKKLSCGEVA